MGNHCNYPPCASTRTETSGQGCTPSLPMRRKGQQRHEPAGRGLLVLVTFLAKAARASAVIQKKARTMFLGGPSWDMGSGHTQGQ